MEIRKTYRNINPTLLYDEVREFLQKQGVTLNQNRLETYSMPSDSSSFIYRGTLTFNVQGQEAVRVHIIGTDKADTKMIVESRDELYPPAKLTELDKGLDFMLGPFEAK